MAYCNIIYRLLLALLLPISANIYTKLVACDYDV